MIIRSISRVSKSQIFFPKGNFPWGNQPKTRKVSSPLLFSVDDEKPSPTKFAGPFSGLSVSGLITGIFLGLGTLFIGLACMISALHRIDEGHVGVYYKFGALMEVKSPPGVHWMQPFVTQVASIRLENRGWHSVGKLLKMSRIFFSRLTPETRTMDPMVCTTRDGVRNVFRDVQVIIKSLLCEGRLFCNPLCKSNPIFCPTFYFSLRWLLL